MKLLEGSIKNWGDLEKLFLTRFFENNSEVTMPTLLATKQRKGESAKSFVERFWNVALRCPSGMTQVTLVETCRHNPQSPGLGQKKTSPDPKGRQGACQKHLFNQRGKITWRQRPNPLSNLSRSREVALQVSYAPISSIPSKTNMLIRCSSYSTRATD